MNQQQHTRSILMVGFALMHLIHLRSFSVNEISRFSCIVHIFYIENYGIQSGGTCFILRLCHGSNFYGRILFKKKRKKNPGNFVGITSICIPKPNSDTHFADSFCDCSMFDNVNASVRPLQIFGQS